MQAFNLLLEAKKRVIFMGATNYPNMIDEAVIDRFKTVVRVPLPGPEVRENYFMRKLKVLTLEEGLTYESMAEATENFGFRDLDSLLSNILPAVRKAAIEAYRVEDANGEIDVAATDAAAAAAIREGRVLLTAALFEEALKKSPPSGKADIRAALEEFERRLGSAETVG